MNKNGIFFIFLSGGALILLGTQSKSTYKISYNSKDSGRNFVVFWIECSQNDEVLRSKLNSQSATEKAFLCGM